MADFFIGREGFSAGNTVGQQGSAERSLGRQAQAATASPVLQALQQYGAGEIDLQEALAAAGQDGDTQAQLGRMLATDPQAATQFAEDQLLGTGVGSQLYGNEGLMQRLASEEQDLAGQDAFRLTEADQTAFGQAAGDITRRSGQQEAQLANMLAQRGLGQSGAAGAAFSGLAGNKFEQLARAQTDLAQRRVDSARQRLQQNRQMQQQLGGQFGQELGRGRTQNLQGAQFGFGQQQSQAQRDYERRLAEQQQKNIELAQKQATRKKGLFEQLGEGIAGGAQQAGQQVGTLGTGFLMNQALPFMSDERAKTDVGSGEEVSNMFRNVDSVTFKYKGGDGSEKGGLMAQQLQQAGPVGEGMVVDTPQGKMVDSSSAISAILAELANQRKELDRRG